MNNIVIYKSTTGFTRAYAEMISKALCCKALELEAALKSDLTGIDTIIYGGGIYAGSIGGVKKIKPLLAAFNGRKYVFAVGATPQEALTSEKLCEIHKLCFLQNEVPVENLYYMCGGLDYKNMKFHHTIMMKMMLSMIKKQKGAESNEYKVISSSYNAVNEENAKPLIEAVKGA